MHLQLGIHHGRQLRGRCPRLRGHAAGDLADALRVDQQELGLVREPCAVAKQQLTVYNLPYLSLQSIQDELVDIQERLRALCFRPMTMPLGLSDFPYVSEACPQTDQQAQRGRAPGMQHET